MENALLFIENGITVSYCGDQLFVLSVDNWVNATNWTTETALSFINYIK